MSAGELESARLRRDLRGPFSGASLTPRQQRTIVALIEQPTIRGAAGAVGVGESTVRRWLKDPAFEHAYRAERSRTLEGAIAKLQAASTNAVEALTRNLTCGLPAVEVRAAQAILDRALEGEETYALADYIVTTLKMLEQLPQESQGYGT